MSDRDLSTDSERGDVRRIRLIFEGITIHGRLRETGTAEAVWGALPLASSVLTWGEEVYFQVPISVEPEAEARALVTAGEIAVWPDGDAIAIGFGATPISAAGEIRLASPCNVWADAEEDVTRLGAVRAGTPVKVEPA